MSTPQNRALLWAAINNSPDVATLAIKKGANNFTEAKNAASERESFKVLYLLCCAIDEKNKAERSNIENEWIATLSQLQYK